MSDDVLNLLDDLNVKSCIIVGHSIGAKTAMCISTKLKDRIKGLVIIDAAPLDYIKIQSIYKANMNAINRAYNYDKTLKEFKKEFSRSTRKTTYDLFIENIIHEGEEKIRWRCDIESIHLNFRNLIGFERFEQNFYNDVLILIGEKSHQFRANHYSHIFPLIEDKNLKIIQGAG